MTEKAKAWWSSDGKWFCILANGGVNQATVSLTPEEATNLSAALSAPRVEPVARDPKLASLRPDLAAPPSQPGTGMREAPVAWRVRSYLGLYEITQDPKLVKNWRAHGIEAEPLYAHPAPPDTGWQPIETAPKDGTWFWAYRPPAMSGIQDTLVVASWDQESNDFVWPTEVYDAYSPPDLSELDEQGFVAVDVYEGQGSFTHWMPLPAPPDAGDRGS